jgi:hypothetical protein
MRFDIVNHNGNDLYLTSATIMNFMEVLDRLGLIEINSAYHSEGYLHVNIE